VKVKVLTLLSALALLGLAQQVLAAKDVSPWNPMRYFHRDTEKEVSNVEIQVPEKVEKAKKETPVKLTQGALIETQKGNIAIEFFPEQAPMTVENFTKLVEQNFYNAPNMKFHRVVPGFVIQTGDPTGTGAGGSKKTIPLEAKNKLSHNAKGIVAMARSGDPNSATSQFYITLTPQVALDGKYAIFGRVISGMDVLDQIRQGDRLYGVKLIDTTTVVPDKKPEEKKGMGQSIKNIFSSKS
jgi:peptidyl-prolyl cis-trans isomerase B (cyclophilin B)